MFFMPYSEKDRADGRADRPVVNTYDSGYEHSIEHVIYLRHLVDQEIEVIEEPVSPAEVRGVAV
jgi:hypothetical protein